MDALCGLFDAVACVGELLGRGSEKEGELATLVSTVESVSQSVCAFVSELDTAERECVFNSNQVFPQLAKHLGQCNDVISKYRCRSGQQQIEDKQESSRPLLAGLKRGLLQSQRTLNEGMELLSGKLGSLGAGLLNLPEDELAVIRQNSQELARLVPQLNLAISVYTLRGQKRALASPAWTTSEPPSRVPRLTAPAPGGDAAAGIGSEEPSQKESLLRMQLFSDYDAAKACDLPMLNAQELRPITSASSSSVDSSMGAAKEGVTRCVFGRLELRDKVPKAFRLPTKTGEAPQPVTRFISRDMFVLDIPRDVPGEVPGDTMEGETLAFGGGAVEDAGATLAWGGGELSVAPVEKPLATISGLSANGLHLRTVGETRWLWLAKEQEVALKPGDQIALLLESPPGSCTPGPPRDLGAEDARCLMGLEFQSP